MPSVCCNICKKEFSKPLWAVKEHNFCSKECRLRWFGALNPPLVRLKCTRCEREFSRQHRQIWPTGNNFCSRKCQGKWHANQMQGNDNPFAKKWQGMTKEERAKYRDKLRGRNFGRRYSPEVNKKKGLPGELNPFYRHKHSKETRETISRLASARMSNPTERQRIIEAVFAANRLRPNKAELKLEEILMKHFPGEWRYTGDGHHIIGGYVPDFSNANGVKAVIELFGKFWHTRPNVRENYTEPGRIQAYRELGFPCLVIWDTELKDEQAVVVKVQQFMRSIT